MFGQSVNNSTLGRNLALLISLFVNKPVFEHELFVQNKDCVLKTASSKHEELILNEDYEKLEAIKKSSRYNYLLWWLFRALCYVSIAKGLIYVYVAHFQYEAFPRVAGLAVETLQNGATTTTIYSYHCLKNNCSSLFGAHLETFTREQNLAKLPAFFICHQSLASMIYAPMDQDFATGPWSLNFLIASYALIDLVVHKSRGNNGHQENSMLMFLVAPNLAYKIMLEKAKLYLREVRQSRRNFIELERIKRFERINSSRNKALSAFERSELTRSELSGCISSTCNQTSMRGQPTLMLNDMIMCQFDQVDTDRFAQECLPLVRSRWWHDLMMATVKFMFGHLIVVLSSMLLLGFTVNSYIATSMSELAQELHIELEQANCSVWYRTEESDENEAMKTKPNFKVLWFVYSAIVYTLLSIWPIVQAYDLFLTAWELRCWICELRYKLVIIRPLLVGYRCWSSGIGLIWYDEPDMVFRYDKFRDKFKREVKAGFLLVGHESFVNFEKRIENERMLEENYFHAANNNDQFRFGPEKMLAQLLEKLYVEMRLMNDYKDKTERRMSAIILVSMALNYYIFFVTIYLGVVMQGLNTEMKLILCVVISLPVLLIINSAIMSQQALKLNPLIRSMLADSGLANDCELRHVRLLWLKLIDRLESNHVHSVFARFTYVNMIQIVVGIATMALFIVRIKETPLATPNKCLLDKR